MCERVLNGQQRAGCAAALAPQASCTSPNPPNQLANHPKSCPTPCPCLQHAVSFCESHAALTAANRFSPHVRGFVRLVHAALKHPLR